MWYMMSKTESGGSMVLCMACFEAEERTPTKAARHNLKSFEAFAHTCRSAHTTKLPSNASKSLGDVPNTLSLVPQTPNTWACAYAPPRLGGGGCQVDVLATASTLRPPWSGSFFFLSDSRLLCLSSRKRRQRQRHQRPAPAVVSVFTLRKHSQEVLVQTSCFLFRTSPRSLRVCFRMEVWLPLQPANPLQGDVRDYGAMQLAITYTHDYVAEG